MAMTSAPAAAASGDLDKQAKPVATRAVLNAFAPQVRGGWPGDTVYLDAAQVWYDYNAWALTGTSAHNDGPQLATVIWRVVVKNDQGDQVATLVEQRTDVLTPYSNAQVGNRQVSGLAAGAYTVVSEIISVEFSSPAGPSFVNRNLAASSTVTVG